MRYRLCLDCGFITHHDTRKECVNMSCNNWDTVIVDFDPHLSLKEQVDAYIKEHKNERHHH